MRLNLISLTSASEDLPVMDVCSRNYLKGDPTIVQTFHRKRYTTGCGIEVNNLIAHHNHSHETT